MSDQDRGAYTPPSDRLSFDPREPVRSGGPAPVTLIVSGIVLLAIVGGVFLLYRGGIRHKGDAPVAVGEPIAQMKSPAPPDANDMPPGLVISKVDASNMTAANATFAPPPEEPLPRPLPVQPPSVVTSTPLPPPMASAPQRLALPAAAPRPAATTPAKPAKPVTIASLTDDAMAQKPVVKPTPAPPAAPAAIATTAAAPPSGGGWVQIGAFSSSALADKGWSDVAALAPAGMSGKGRKVEPVSKDGKTFYRTYVTGFSGRDTAQAFCDKLKAAGKACFVK